jgi:hypothetical protein
VHRAAALGDAPARCRCADWARASITAARERDRVRDRALRTRRDRSGAQRLLRALGRRVGVLAAFVVAPRLATQSNQQREPRLRRRPPSGFSRDGLRPRRGRRAPARSGEAAAGVGRLAGRPAAHRQPSAGGGAAGGGAVAGGLRRGPRGGSRAPRTPSRPRARPSGRGSHAPAPGRPGAAASRHRRTET